MAFCCSVVSVALVFNAVLLPISKNLVFHLFDPKAPYCGRYVEIYQLGSQLVLAPFDLFYDHARGRVRIHGTAYSRGEADGPSFLQRWGSGGEAAISESPTNGITIRYLYGSNFEKGSALEPKSVEECSLNKAGPGVGFFCHVDGGSHPYEEDIRRQLEGRPFSASTMEYILTNGILAPKIEFAVFRANKPNSKIARVSEVWRFVLDAFFQDVDGREEQQETLARQILAVQADHIFGRHAFDVNETIEKIEGSAKAQNT